MRLDASRAFMREIRVVIARSDCKVRSDDRLLPGRLVRRVCRNLVKVERDEDEEEE